MGVYMLVGLVFVLITINIDAHIIIFPLMIIKGDGKEKLPCSAKQGSQNENTKD
ncbi:hypothetical protein ABID56_001542 [Alkalibacillus flavidus]|uniref:Uncharacterized protein n=1 Tax=Alkalibacillus flavidus TaxID=546021 RepID=A0ABV2KWG4_9BACI